jgi:hypothetical protein
MVEHIDTVLFCDFISRWPTLSAVRHAHRKTLETFFHSHNCRRPLFIERRLESIRCAIALTDDPGIVSPCRLHALALVTQLSRTAERYAASERVHDVAALQQGCLG